MNLEILWLVRTFDIYTDQVVLRVYDFETFSRFFFIAVDLKIDCKMYIDIVHEKIENSRNF